MVRIVSDTSTMYSTTQAEAAGFFVSALSVTIAGKSYKEYDEISSDEFVDIIRQGHMPTSSQPAIGAVSDLYANYPGEGRPVSKGGTGYANPAAASAGKNGHRQKLPGSGGL